VSSRQLLNACRQPRRQGFARFDSEKQAISIREEIAVENPKVAVVATYPGMGDDAAEIIAHFGLDVQVLTGDFAEGVKALAHGHPEDTGNAALPGKGRPAGLTPANKISKGGTK
jgi:hypothetical protein